MTIFARFRRSFFFKRFLSKYRDERIVQCGSLVYNYDEFITSGIRTNKGATRGNMKRDSTMLRLIDAANLHCLLNLRIKIPIFPFFNAPPPRFSLSRCPTRIRRSMHHFQAKHVTDHPLFCFSILIIFLFYSYLYFFFFYIMLYIVVERKFE